MRHTIKIYSIPLWPLVKNVFLITVILFTVFAIIGGFLWFGFMKSIAAYLPEYNMQSELNALQNLSSIFRILFAIFYGVISSAIFTFATGLAGMIYNFVNRKNGGLEVEISLPDFFGQYQSQSDATRRTTEPDEEFKPERNESEPRLEIDDDTKE
jgi:hypothetical protein